MRHFAVSGISGYSAQYGEYIVNRSKCHEHTGASVRRITNTSTVKEQYQDYIVHKVSL